MEEYEKMNKRSINMNPGLWFSPVIGIKIASLNVARLETHMEDIKVDPTLLQADLIHLSETWVKPEDECRERLQLPGFSVSFVSLGEGRGIATYSKQNFVHTDDVKKERYQATKFSSADVDSINVYWSATGSLSELREDLKRLIHQDKATIISGDFNICLEKDPNNMITTYLRGEGFNQLVRDPTHINGGHIDHMYVRDKKNIYMDPAS